MGFFEVLRLLVSLECRLQAGRHVNVSSKVLCFGFAKRGNAVNDGKVLMDHQHATGEVNVLPYRRPIETVVRIAGHCRYTPAA